MPNYSTTTAVATAFIKQLSREGVSSHISFRGNILYSYATPVAMLDTSRANGQVYLFTTSIDYSQTTSRHVSLATTAFYARYGYEASSRVIAVADPRAPTGDRSLWELIYRIEQQITRATTGRILRPARINALNSAERLVVQLTTLTDEYATAWLTNDDKLFNHRQHLYKLFHTLPTQSPDTPSNFWFVPRPAVHTEATLTALCNLRAIAALEQETV